MMHLAEQTDTPPIIAASVPTVMVLSRFTIANGMDKEVKEAFLNRPHLVDDTPGFIRMEVLSPQDNPDEIWLATYWSNEESYRTWHRGHTYRDSHAGIPKGLKLIPRSTEIRMFNYICS
jgi:heme-degrading monooxygenase HmoA